MVKKGYKMQQTARGDACPAQPGRSACKRHTRAPARWSPAPLLPAAHGPLLQSCAVRSGWPGGSSKSPAAVQQAVQAAPLAAEKADLRGVALEMAPLLLAAASMHCKSRQAWLSKQPLTRSGGLLAGVHPASSTSALQPSYWQRAVALAPPAPHALPVPPLVPQAGAAAAAAAADCAAAPPWAARQHTNSS